MTYNDSKDIVYNINSALAKERLLNLSAIEKLKYFSGFVIQSKEFKQIISAIDESKEKH